ncbi:MAG: bifunctional pyr operon transcriptional regulator/uracil phosphoribosyltransferase PyrR [Longimicrobiales bacterium]
MTAPNPTVLMDGEAVKGALDRMSKELWELIGESESLVVMGIQRRGVHLAEMVRRAIEESSGHSAAAGSLDITLYRDDLMAIGPRPLVGESKLPADGVDERPVVLVDDVLYTGRTVRAALNELMDWGRPSRILLCVLVDRGGRELPIQPDVVGLQVVVEEGQRVDVRVPQLDDELAVVLSDRAP